MSVTYVNWTSRVAIAGRVAETRRQFHSSNDDDPGRLPPAVRQNRSTDRSTQVDLARLGPIMELHN
jgi:hypothetical protein